MLMKTFGGKVQSAAHDTSSLGTHHVEFPPDMPERCGGHLGIDQSSEGIHDGTDDHTLRP